ncbi:MAG: metalloregulator ArsR/SmtB family transcription factor [Hyphomonas sp.]
MAKHFSSDPAALDRGFHALSDATRRAVIARLTKGEASVAELAAPFDMALPSFLQHVKVLEGAGLITTVKRGRVRTCTLAAGRLAELNQWINRHEAAWVRKLDRLGAILDRKDDTQ